MYSKMNKGLLVAALSTNECVALSHESCTTSSLAQLENATDTLGAAATGGLEEQMSSEEMVERLTALCEKTHDADCYE
jgi:hypothetical protein